jgi:2-polyprenyl-3-methyl-5-hydroxy-6-metoxy-1,4-benzoquinol methylase
LIQHDSDRLQKRYLGKAALQYDAKRASSQRYKEEEQAFAELFRIVNPKSVLDCPFGTGRWLEYYLNSGSSVIAIDYSEDMLAEAEKKLPLKTENISFRVASVFEYDFSQHVAENIDLVVCTRFLNWVTYREAEAILAKLSSSNSRFGIFGVSVRPLRLPRGQSSIMKIRLAYSNLKRSLRRKAHQYVHAQEDIEAAFQSVGWHIVEKRRIFTSSTRDNVFYLVSRKCFNAD